MSDLVNDPSLSRRATFSPPLKAITTYGLDCWLYAVDGNQWLVQRRSDNRPEWCPDWLIMLPLPDVP